MITSKNILSILEDTTKYIAIGQSGQELEVTPKSVSGISVVFNGRDMDDIKRKIGTIKSFAYEINGIRKKMVRGIVTKSPASKYDLKYTTYTYFKKD